MCGNVKRKQAEIQHLNETFQKLHLKNQSERQKGHVHDTPT